MNYLPLLSELEELGTSENETGIFEEPFASKSFYKEIIIAIQSFKKKTRLTKEENTLFQLYLNHGNVDISTKSTTRVANIDAACENEADVEFMIHSNYKSVDFFYTLHTFIVDIFLKNIRYTQKPCYDKVGPLIKSFLVYLEENRVCPEYTNDIRESIQLCDKVAIELPLMKELSSNFPDKINKSFSLLYGGTWSAIGNTEAGISLKDKANLDQILGFDLNAAKLVTGFETRGQLKVEKRLVLNMYITFVDKETNNLYLKEKCESYEPLEFTIEVDSEIVKYCIKDFILDGSFIKLSDGTWYFDQLFYIFPPFSYINTPI